MNTHIQTHVMPAKGATYRIDFVLDGARREAFIHNALCAKHAPPCAPRKPRPASKAGPPREHCKRPRPAAARTRARRPPPAKQMS